MKQESNVSSQEPDKCPCCGKNYYDVLGIGKCGNCFYNKQSSDQNVQECDATKAQSLSEPLAQMTRPKIKDYFNSAQEIHESFTATGSKQLYNYTQALDLYVDHLESMSELLFTK